MRNLVITVIDEYDERVDFVYRADEWDSFDYSGLYFMVCKDNQIIGLYNQKRIIWVRVVDKEDA